jgi:hypothetical protein
MAKIGSSSRLGHLSFALYGLSYILPAVEIAGDGLIGAWAAALSFLGIVVGITEGLEAGQWPACVLGAAANILMLCGYVRFCIRCSSRKWRPSYRITAAISGSGAICAIGSGVCLATGAESFVPRSGFFLWLVSMMLLTLASWRAARFVRCEEKAAENGAPAAPVGDFAVSNRSSLRALRPWLVGMLVIATVATVIWFTGSRERRDIRYQAAGEWRLPGESMYIGEPPQGRYASVAVGAGFMNDGNWFRVVGSALKLGASPIDRPNTLLALPSELLDSRFWNVIVSADGRRIICVNERGLAVWRADPPHDLMHLWTNTTEPMAGEKVGTDYNRSTPHDSHELALSYEVSPDGSLVCVYASKQRSFRHDRPRPNGIVILRDLESGQDVAQLVHPGSGATIPRIAWSSDSRRLATFARKAEQITVWDVTERKTIGRINEFAEELALSADGNLVYSSVFTGKTTTGTSGPNSPRTVAHRVADGTRVGSRKIASSHLVLSPDGRYLAASTRNGVELMDSASLESIWNSPFGWCGDGIKFRPDGNELAAVSVDISGLWATGRVKAWAVVDGTVILAAATNAASGATSGVGFGNDGAIWTYGPSNWSRFKPVSEPSP